MAQGHVKWFSSEKGYGFIERDGEEDVFVHHSQITMEGFRTLDAGEPVEFEIIAGDRGPKARNVLRSDQPSGASSNGQATGHRNGSSTTTATLGLVGQIRERLFGRLTKHA